MSLLSDFKSFAIKGNVVDLAVGVIIGQEFGKIVNSLVNDIILPPIGRLVNGTNFVNMFYSLDGNEYDTLAAAKEAGVAVFAYGSFIQAVVNFMIIAFAIFMMVQLVNRFRKRAEDKPAAAPAEDVLLLREIRDLLKKEAA